MATGAELKYQTNASALVMAQTIFGGGVAITGASYTGDNRSSAIYSLGDSRAPGATPGDTGIILSTGRANHYTRSNGDPNRAGNTSTNTSGQDNDADFNAAAGATTYDASYLEVDFIPTGSALTMQFIFASEEYPEYINSIYQDFVGVWVNGSQADITVGDGDTDPGNINPGANSNLYLSNIGDAYNTEMDGLTVTMTLTMQVNPGVVNSLKLGIADVSDTSYDSNLLIAAGSLQTELIAHDDSVQIDPNGTRDIDLLANDVNTTGGTLTITHINGQTVSVGSFVTLGTGQIVTLNGDGTVTVFGDGDEEQVNFTYTAESSTGASDTGYVLLDMVPCFVAGTMIDTQEGALPVDVLEPGDMIKTRDAGYQPLRWVGQRTVPATGVLAPVEIAAKTFGDHARLRVSPLHRILIRDTMAELLFGEAEVLVAAKELINDSSVRIREGGEVTYVHLLLTNIKL